MEKILDLEKLKEMSRKSKADGKKLVWTNGCFDLLHIGHIRYLNKAKSFGDILIVGLNSDSSVKSLKGPKRPIQSQSDRAEILSNLECVDYVLIFDETSVEKYLLELKPNVFVKGGNYTLEMLDQDEKKTIEGYGGQIYFIPMIQGKSSTDIIEKIKNSLKK